jgi:hypothetical protein
MTPRSATNGGEIPGGKTCCSPDLRMAQAVDWARAGCVGFPHRVRYLEVLASTVTRATCAVTTVCSQCGDVAVSVAERPWPRYV